MNTRVKSAKLNLKNALSYQVSRGVPVYKSLLHQVLQVFFLRWEFCVISSWLCGAGE